MLKLKNLLFTEDVKDIVKAKKIRRQIQGDESRMRLHMYDLAQRMDADLLNQKFQA